MFKKKITYIIGIVIFTLILIADLVLFFAVPTGRGTGDMPSFDKGSFDAESFDGEMPEGFDAENFNFEDFGGEMPEGFSKPDGSSGEMPEGFSRPDGDGGEIPEGFTMGEDGEIPEGFTMGEDGEMPENFDMSSMPGRGQGGRGNQGANIIKIAFWPILIISILGDGFCIFMLVRLSKKKEDDGSNVILAEKETAEEIGGDNSPKKDKTNTYLGIVAGVLAVAVMINSLSSGIAASTREAEETIVQDDVLVSDIISTFSGSGTLKSSEGEEMMLPSSVSVLSYTVKNGDYVEKGDVIAKVKKESVLNAIYEIQNLIDEMDKEIAEVKSETLDSTITARADGRVKAVYAKTGESVSEAMYNNGALILISLGGSMTVEVESDKEVTVGQTLSVKLSDKSTVEGKVQQVRNGIITVTTTDNGPTHGDKVTVYTEDGTKLGKGTLEVSSALKVTGYAGTVKSIYVEVDEKVSTGDTLLSLEDTQDKARYQQLLREREELVTMQTSLSEMYQDGTVKAQQSGIISSLSEDIDYIEPAETTTETKEVTELSVSQTNSEATKLSYTTSKAKVMSLSLGVQGEATTQSGEITTTQEVNTSQETTLPEKPSTPISEETTSQSQETTRPTEETTTSSSEETTTKEEQTITPPDTTIPNEQTTTLPTATFPNEQTTTPPTATIPNEQATTSPSTTIPNEQATTFPSGEFTPPSENVTTPSQTQTDGVYAGKVMAVIPEALSVKMSEKDMTDEKVSSLETIDETLFTKDGVFIPSADVKVYLFENGKSVSSSLSAIQAGDKVFLTIEKGVLTRIDFIAGDGETKPSQNFSPDTSVPDENVSGENVSGGTFPGVTDSTDSQFQGEMPSANVGGNYYGTGGSMDISSGMSGFNYQQTESEEEEEATYIVDEISLCAITPSDTMTIDVSVDELDILSLKVGQEATVTLDALPGQSTVGVIKKLYPIGTTEDGGSTKYTAVISVSRTEEMLDGMNASVKIEVGSLENVLTIPAAAVYEDGNRTYVYTSANTKDGELKKSIDITTGASDGTNIEVLSGLSEGDTVYYSYADSIVYRTGR